MVALIPMVPEPSKVDEPTPRRPVTICFDPPRFPQQQPVKRPAASSAGKAAKAPRGEGQLTEVFPNFCLVQLSQGSRPRIVAFKRGASKSGPQFHMVSEHMAGGLDKAWDIARSLAKALAAGEVTAAELKSKRTELLKPST